MNSLIVLIAFAALTTSPGARAQVFPQLFFEPAPVFDQECAAKTGVPIKPEIAKELYEKLGVFQTAWDAEAAKLIPASEAVTGRKFFRKEYSVNLTACMWTPMGDPAFIINMNAFLGPKAAPMPVFISMVHHELLHSLVDNLMNDDFAAQSPMIVKYQKEPINVLVHLHLMAIQKAAYESLGRSDLVKETDRLYLQLIGGAYKRAWEIVGIEGTKPFLEETRAFNSRPGK
jgi:hypothetical protein